MFLTQLSGNSQGSSGAELIEFFLQSPETASLIIESLDASALLLLHQGKVQKHYSFAKALDMDLRGLEFFYYQHPMNGHIEFPSRFPASINPLLRALPALPETYVRLAKGQDFSETLKLFVDESFSGYVRLEADLKQGVLLIKEGAISMAVVEHDDQIQEDNDALRTLRSLPLESHSLMALRPLAPTILEGLLSLAAKNRSHGSHIFNGLECTEAGYAFFKDGRVILRTSAELMGDAGYYPNLTSARTLAMPDEPPGWEQKAYLLTLRGRDALNAITDLAMQFQQSFGDEGKKVLSRVAKDKTPEVLANSLQLNLTDLKSWLDRLEREGLIRQVSAS
ncbi:MAG: hypothetical protein KC422_14485 [Trueperaceae bacterium]|nr:hypothetical protein [Trueperaceae bacterium]